MTMATINSGITLRLMPLTSFTLTNIKASSSIAFPIAQHIEAGVFTEADLIVRLHSGTTMSAGQSVAFSIVPDGWDFEDPTGSFLGTALATFTQSGAPTLPAYSVTSTGTSAFGRFLSVSMPATQPSTAATLVVVASVDLVLKGGDPTNLPRSPNGFVGYRIM
jgi:hypothetical protein